jgi:hypothetical protein
MAITKTQKLISITYREDMVTIPKSLYVDYQITLDDPEDSSLPVYTNKGYTLIEDSDISNEEELVQNIFNAVFNK